MDTRQPVGLFLMQPTPELSPTQFRTGMSLLLGQQTVVCTNLSRRSRFLRTSINSLMCIWIIVALRESKQFTYFRPKNLSISSDCLFVYIPMYLYAVLRISLSSPKYSKRVTCSTFLISSSSLVAIPS